MYRIYNLQHLRNVQRVPAKYGCDSMFHNNPCAGNIDSFLVCPVKMFYFKKYRSCLICKDCIYIKVIYRVYV